MLDLNTYNVQLLHVRKPTDHAHPLEFVKLVIEQQQMNANLPNKLRRAVCWLRL